MNSSRATFRRLAALCVATSLTLNSTTAQAATYYWDVNGSVAGTGGPTPSGAWDGTNTFWNNNSSGGVGTFVASPTTSDDLIFAAGSDATGSYSVTLSGTRNGRHLTFEDGDATLTGGTLNLTASPTITVNSGLTGTIASNLSGATGTISKQGAGTLALSGSGSLGRIDISAGTLRVASGAAITLSSYFTSNPTAGAVTTNYTQTGGSLTTNLGLYINNLGGVGSNSLFTVSGGSLTQTGTSDGIRMARGGGEATLNLSGAGTVSGYYVQMGQSSGSATNNTTINLGDNTNFTGGTSIANDGQSGQLSVQVVNRIGGGTHNLYFNGGALVSSGTSLTGGVLLGQGGAALANVFVSHGGGIIDNGGNTISINQPLLHDPAAAAIDGGMVFRGAGTTNLNSANTYTGATRVNAGTLKAGVASVANVSGAFGNNSAVVMADVAGAGINITGFNTQIGSLSGGGAAGGNVTLGTATLTLGGDNTSPAAFGGAITGTGTLVKIGAGTQTFNGAGSNFARLDINAGTLQLTSGAAISLSSYLTSNTTAGAVTTNYTQTGGSLSTSLGIYINNLGGAGSNSIFTVSDGSLTQTGVADLIRLARGGGSATLNISGAGTVSGYLAQVGQASGTTTTTINLGDNTNFTGGSSIAAGGQSGQLTVQAVNRVGSGTHNLYFNGGALVSSGVSYNGGVLLGHGGATLSNVYVSHGGGIIDNGGNSIFINQALQHDPAADALDGGMVFRGAGTTTLNSANTYTGATRVNAGTLTYGVNNALAAGAVTVNGASAVLNLGAFSDTVGAVTLAGGGQIISSTGTLTNTVGYDLRSGSASARLAGAVNATKSTAGTVILSGNNTYTGTTSVNAGKLLVNGTHTGAGAYTVASGATLGGTGTITPSGSAGVSVFGAVAPGASIGTLTFNFGSTTGGVNFSPGAAFDFEVDAPGVSDLIRFNNFNVGDVVFNNNVISFTDLGNFAPGLYTLFSFYSDNGVTPINHNLTSGLVLADNAVGSLIYNGNLIQVQLNAIVPEPSTWLLCGLGAVLFGVGAWRKRRARRVEFK